MTSEFGIIGLGVMGKSLARNFANQGFKLSLYNRHVPNIEEHVAKTLIETHSELKGSLPFDDLQLFVESLQTPRKILIMVNAGVAIDNVIDALLKLVEPNDIVIDGGNSHYKKTALRSQLLKQKDIHFIGMGVSGGEEGALHGPSLMPGGNLEAYEEIAPYLKKIAAKNSNDLACCNYIGQEGAGHFVKMVHNGIEYVEMQLIAEIYAILRYHNKLQPNQISDVFEAWNNTELENYLLESTAVILKKKDGDAFLIDLVLDKASHKGTGSWTSIAAAELGVPFTLCASALNARYVSALKTMRIKLANTYKFEDHKTSKAIDISVLKEAYQASRIINHHQGLLLINEASKVYQWHIDIKNVANVWTAGCIIASRLMNNIVTCIDTTPEILDDPSMSKQLQTSHNNLKHVVTTAINSDIPVPCLSESINYMHAITQASGSGNIIQSQRDFFGAHTYKRIDDPKQKDHHTNWTNA